MDNKYAARISALLAKAEATDSDEEAQAYSAKAAELITRYGIEQAEIDAIRAAKGEAKGKIIEKYIWFGGTHSLGLVSGAFSVVAAASGGTVKALRSLRAVNEFRGLTGGRQDPNRDTRKGYYLTLIGYESDVEQLEILISSIMLQSLNALRRYLKTRDYRAATIWESAGVVKRSFVEGYFDGAAEKIRTSRREVLDEVASSGTEIALRDRAQEVNDFLKIAHPKMRNARQRNWSSTAHSVGHEAGRNADTGQSSIRNSKALV